MTFEEAVDVYTKFDPLRRAGVRTRLFHLSCDRADAEELVIDAVKAELRSDPLP